MKPRKWHMIEALQVIVRAARLKKMYTYWVETKTQFYTERSKGLWLVPSAGNVSVLDII